MDDQTIPPALRAWLHGSERETAVLRAGGDAWLAERRPTPLVDADATLDQMQREREVQR